MNYSPVDEDPGRGNHSVQPSAEQAVEALRLAKEERRRAEELKVRARQQATIAELGLMALADNQLDDLLQQATVIVSETLNAEFCKILALSPEGDLCFKSGVGWGPSPSPIDSTSQSGYTLKVKEPVVVDDLDCETRFTPGLFTVEHGVKSGVTVIIHGQEQPFGVLGVHSRQLRRFSTEDVHFVQAAANILAMAVRRKQADDALRQSEAQLRQAQKMEAIGRLAGGVAHDFNNLLTAILGYTDGLLADLRRNDRIRRDIGEIDRAARQAAALTRQLLTFGRRQMLDPKILDVNVVASDLQQILLRIIGEDIDLVTMPSPEPAWVKADRAQLEQVLMNLVVNARDAMQHGGRLTVEITFLYFDEGFTERHMALQPGPYVTLLVSDTGCGMDPATQERIFEPFFTTKLEGQGTGLGLSTVYGIVTQSGGHVSVYSEPGQGTTFKIYLPRVSEEPERQDTSDQVRAAGGNETILLVEDTQLVRELAFNILEGKGYTVLEASQGDDALRICEQYEGRIHLMLTDVVMPRMSGGELADKVAAIRSDMKVLYMSGYTKDVMLHRGLLDPAAPLLFKPFTPNVLARKIRHILDNNVVEERW